MPRGLWRLSVGEQLRSSAFGPAQAVGLWASSGREQTRVEEIVDDLERVRTRTHLAGTLQLDGTSPEISHCASPCDRLGRMSPTQAPSGWKKLTRASVGL